MALPKGANRIFGFRLIDAVRRGRPCPLTHHILRGCVIPAGIAGIPRTYRQKVWWLQGTLGSRRR